MFRRWSGAWLMIAFGLVVVCVEKACRLVTQSCLTDSVRLLKQTISAARLPYCIYTGVPVYLVVEALVIHQVQAQLVSNDHT